MYCEMFDLDTGLVLKYPEHDPGQKVFLPTSSATFLGKISGVEAFVCKRCRLLFVPEKKETG